VAYVRRKRLKGHDYYYLVESYRQDGKVKTRTLKYLGTTPQVPSPVPVPAGVASESPATAAVG